MGKLGLMIILYAFFWWVVLVVKTFELTREGFLMVVVFLVSLMCHYVWLFDYLYRGRKRGGPLWRLPNMWEVVVFVLNISFTVASFVEVCRRMFGWRWRFQFLAEWVAVLYLVYGGVVLVDHIFWLKIWKTIGFYFSPPTLPQRRNLETLVLTAPSSPDQRTNPSTTTAPSVHHPPSQQPDTEAQPILNPVAAAPHTSPADPISNPTILAQDLNSTTSPATADMSERPPARLKDYV